jgi:hypothetical protein
LGTYKNSLFTALLTIILLFLSGCSVPPPESEIEEAIIKHFEEKQFKVLAIVMGDLRPIPPREKQYMGTEGYIIDIPLVTLEFTKDRGESLPYKIGQHVTFKNAHIRIKKRTGKNGKWIITDIAGIPII